MEITKTNSSVTNLSAYVKNLFFDHFESNGFKFIEGSSLLTTDKTLLFTNSGMCQFKPIFMGTDQPAHKNVYNIQNCLRLGGKHFDFYNVGKDTYHHSFFQMLGNWTFNIDEKEFIKYKEQAINLAWTFLIDKCKLDKNRLYVTYYGNKDLCDTETKDIWLKYLDKDRIICFEKENFWQMADNGPCGPCTEIHYDLLGTKNRNFKVNTDDNSLIEIWNIVFMTYDKQNDKLSKLKKGHIDTGMGFERLVAVLQDTGDNYGTDIFKPIFDIILKITKISPLKSTEIEMAYRVISDHVRCLIYSISDDILPLVDDNKYGVMFRLFKRALFYAHMFLNTPKNDFVKIVNGILDHLCVCDQKIGKTYNTVLYFFQREEKLHNIVWKSVIPFRKLMSKSVKEITSIEYSDLTKTRGIPDDLVEQFSVDFGFTLV